MNKDARWLPMDLTLSDGNHIRSLYVRGGAWQLYTTAEDGQALAVDDALYTRWLSLEWVEEGLFEDVSTEEGTVHVLCARAGSLISSLRYGPYPHQRSQALDFVKALKRSVERMGSLALDDALYVERFSLILSTSDASAGGATVNLAAGRFLTGGMEVPLSAAELVLQYAPYLNESDVNGMLDRLGLSKDEGAAGTLTAPKQAAAAPKPAASRSGRKAGPFSLPGRPKLESFLREEIIDIVDHEDAYRRMGIGFPGGTVLYGPTGCGKTYAIKQLTEYLGWPVYSIDSGSIGSKYVHETSRKISEIFDQAAQNAPSVIVIDELEAFLSSRDGSLGSREIHLEEVAEFLRRIPEAPEKRVLIFGMTNLLDSVDKAILRRGRFDYTIEVGMPSREEIKALLEHLLSDKPTEDGLPLETLADQLSGRPVSDIAFFVREAAKRTIRAGRDKISAEDLITAEKALPKKDAEKRRIGFTTDE